MRSAGFLIAAAAGVLVMNPATFAQTGNASDNVVTRAWVPSGPSDAALAAFDAPVPEGSELDNPGPSVVAEPAEHRPITMQQRLDWWAHSAFGPQTLAAGLLTSAIRTGLDHPEEYGPHWEGYGDRLAVREAGVIVSGAIEVGVGAIWGEDPRYPRAGDEERFSGRLGRVFKYTFMAQDRNGHAMPAYARYIGISSASFLSNEYRVSSEATTPEAMGRIGTAFLSKMASNAFKEFMPDVKRKFFHHSTP